MAGDINISQGADLRDLSRKIRDYGEKGTKAAVMALNSSLEFARTDQAAYLAKRYELPPAYIQSRLKVSKYATPTNLSGEIRARRRPTQARRFKTNQVWAKGKTVPKKRAGINVKIKRGGSTEYWKRAFYLDLKNGNQGIAVRTGRRPDDFKILYSISVGAAFQYTRDNTEIVPRMVEHAKTEFFKYLDN